MVGVIISLLVTIMVVVILLKKMKAQFVLFFGGLTLLVCSIAMDAFGLLPNGAQILPKGVASTGFIGFDLFKCITSLMSSRTAGIGLLIMSAAGYSKYMSMIGASAIMADYLCRPLRIFRSPYFVLSLAYIIGAIADLRCRELRRPGGRHGHDDLLRRVPDPRRHRRDDRRRRPALLHAALL